MTTYNTDNPIGSADPRDLYDNAQVIDDYANSTGATTTDRLGVVRSTIAGIDADARAAIANAGYVYVGDYAAGVELTAYNQVVRDTTGEFWRVSGSTDLPYTTTGAGLPEGGAFVTVGDAALRQDLVQPVATFNNVADMKNAAGLGIGRKARTLGYYSPGDGGGNDYEIVASGTGSNYGFLYEELSGSGLEAKLLGGGIMENKTAYIPSDYATLQEAIDDLSKLHAANSSVIDLLIETGHQPASGVLAKNGVYGHFYISSVDAVVVLSSLFGRDEDFVYAENATAPVLNSLIDAQGRCASGYYCDHASSGKVSQGCGVDYAGTFGCYARGASSISAQSTFFRNASYQKLTGEGTGTKSASGILAWGASIDAQGADCSDSKYYGAQAAAGGYLNFRLGKALNSFSYGVRGTNAGWVNARSADVSGSGANNDVAIRAFDGSYIHAGEIVAKNCIVCAYAEHGSTINLKNADLTGATDTSIVCLAGSIVSADLADMTGSAKAIRVLDGGTVNARGATMNNITSTAIFAYNGGTANISEASVENCGSASSVVSVINGTVIGRFISFNNNTQLILDSDEGGIINVPRSTFVGHGADVVSIQNGSYTNVVFSGLTDTEFNKASNSYTRAGIIIL